MESLSCGAFHLHQNWEVGIMSSQKNTVHTADLVQQILVRDAKINNITGANLLNYIVMYCIL